MTLFVNHLKSMIEPREETREKRERQTAGVKQIIEDRFGPNPGSERFIALGDLNDYLETDDQGKSGIKGLVEWDQVENVVLRRDADDRWTHYWAGGNDYKQLDYLLLSNSLAEASDGEPEIMRKGLPKRARQIHRRALRWRRREQAQGVRALSRRDGDRGRLRAAVDPSDRSVA